MTSDDCNSNEGCEVKPFPKKRGQASRQEAADALLHALENAHSFEIDDGDLSITWLRDGIFSGSARISLHLGEDARNRQIIATWAEMQKK